MLLAAVDTALREMETLCGRAERALMMRRWEDLDAAIADARRATHALLNAMDEAKPARDRSFDEDVMRRVRYVHAIRENQMTRLQQYHDAVSQRLQLVARWKSSLRALAQRTGARTVSVVDSLR